MPTFETAPGLPNSTSYASVAEFKDYWSMWQFRQPAWVPSASDPTIQGALMIAAFLIDADFIWTGAAANPGVQALAWPRNGMLDVNGALMGNIVIPQRLKNAQCEFAGQLYAQDRMADDDADKFQVQSVRAGDVDVRMQRASLETIESADIWARLKGPEFNWMSKQVPEAVRRHLLQSWYKQPTIKRPLVFKTFGSTGPGGSLPGGGGGSGDGNSGTIF